jgi:hypothetical protein
LFLICLWFPIFNRYIPKVNSHEIKQQLYVFWYFNNWVCFFIVIDAFFSNLWLKCKFYSYKCFLIFTLYLLLLYSYFMVIIMKFVIKSNQLISSPYLFQREGTRDEWE